MKGLIKILIFFIALGYGIHYVLSLPGVTLIPPTKNDVRLVIKKAQPDFATSGGLQVTELCTRIGGTFFKNGVFQCNIKLNERYRKALGKDFVILEKRKGKWVWKDKPKAPINL